jgi:hypothetical protein
MMCKAMINVSMIINIIKNKAFPLKRSQDLQNAIST